MAGVGITTPANTEETTDEFNILHNMHATKVEMKLMVANVVSCRASDVSWRREGRADTEESVNAQVTDL